MAPYIACIVDRDAVLETVMLEVASYCFFSVNMGAVGC